MYSRRILSLIRSAFTVIVGFHCGYLSAEEKQEFTQAPPNHAIVSDTINGWYFVPKELKDEYDTTLRRMESLESEIAAGEVGSQAALKEFADLKSRLRALRTKIDVSQIHVAGAVIHEQTETSEFELGPDKRLAITANHVRIVGSAGNKVKVELKKLILSNDGKPVDEHLKSIRIIHKLGRAEFAGQTDAEQAAHEAEFLAKNAGKFNEEQLAARRQLIASIRKSRSVHRELLGKDIDQVTVDGLNYDDNKIIDRKVKSEGGDGQWGSVRQRYAELTVHVPGCTSVTVRGARRGLQVVDLAADLYLVDEDHTDSDARGRFEVLGLNGKLLCRNFPLHVVANVKGTASIESTTEFAVEGAGTRRRDNIREMTPGKSFSVQIHDISDGVNLHYSRANLDLRNVDGTINVINEFGDTQLLLERPLSKAAHRIYSLTGRIEVQMTPEAWNSSPVVAATNHGGVRSNVEREQFEEFHLEGEDLGDATRRSWAGFRAVVEGEDRMAVFRLVHRFAAIASGAERSDGLDLFTRSGRIVVLRKPK